MRLFETTKWSYRSTPHPVMRLRRLTRGVGQIHSLYDFEFPASRSQDRTRLNCQPTKLSNVSKQMLGAYTSSLKMKLK